MTAAEKNEDYETRNAYVILTINTLSDRRPPARAGSQLQRQNGREATMNVLDDLNRVVQQANGRRRDRLLTCRDIVLAALDLANGEHVFLHGGHVAKSYRYKAVATIAVVWRDDQGSARAIVRVGSASKGSTGFGQRRAWGPTPEDTAASVPVPDLRQMTGLDCNEPAILADALDDLGHAQLATMLRIGVTK